MAHAISAVIFRGSFDSAALKRHGLIALPFPQGYIVIPLSASSVERLSEQMNDPELLSERPILNSRSLHRVMAEITSSAFAIVETDYFGGAGDQAAAVYQRSAELLAPRAAVTGPINEALRRIGVKALSYQDEFEALGLQHRRDFDDVLFSS